MVFNFRCVEVLTSADGRREYRLSVIVEQSAPVMFKVGKRYDFMEAGPAAGAKSQLEQLPPLMLDGKLITPKPGDIITISGDTSEPAMQELGRIALAGGFKCISGDLVAVTDEQLDRLGLMRKPSTSGKARA